MADLQESRMIVQEQQIPQARPAHEQVLIPSLESVKKPEINPNSYENTRILNNLTSMMFSSVQQNLESNYSDLTREQTFPKIDKNDNQVFQPEPQETDINSVFEMAFDVKDLEQVLDREYNKEMIKQYHIATQQALDYLHKIGWFRIATYSIGKKFSDDKSPTIIKNIEEYYFKIKAKVESMQTRLAHYCEPLNGHSLGYPRTISLTADFISEAFGIDSTLPSVFISTSDEDSGHTKEVGDYADHTLNLEISESKNNIFVIEGPKWLKGDKTLKIDSLAFFSDFLISPLVIKELMDLVTQLSSLSYSDSLLNDLNLEHNSIDTSNPNSQSTNEILNKLSNSIKSNQYHARLIKKAIIEEKVNEGEIQDFIKRALNTQNSKEFESLPLLSQTELKNQLKKAKDRLESIQEVVRNYTNSFDLILSLIEIDNTEYRNLYNDNNPQSTSLSIYQNPKNKITMFRNGKVYSPIVSENISSIDQLKLRINNLMVQNQIYVKSVQIKNNASSPKTKAKIEEKQCSGALGITQELTADVRPRKTSIDTFFNHVDADTYYPDSIPQGAKRRTNVLKKP